MFGAIVAAATVESQRAVAVLAGVLIAGVHLQNRKDKGRGTVCKAAVSRLARLFSADFCAAIAAIFRLRRAFGLTAIWGRFACPVQISFIALLKSPFKFSDDHRRVGWGQKEAAGAAKADTAA
jgi:hypothetical protein